MNPNDLHAARIEIVDFCIEVFWDVPSEEFVARILSDDIILPDDSVNDRLDEGFDRLRTWRNDVSGDSPADVQARLEQEYTDLFVGPRPPILPHETYYRDDTEFIGTGLAEVEASYSAAGWSPPEDYPEENDFIAVELAFLRTLMEWQAEGREEAFGYERVFIDEHLSKWVDDFIADLREETKDDGLYLAGGLVFGGLVEFEDELVAQLVSG